MKQNVSFLGSVTLQTGKGTVSHSPKVSNQSGELSYSVMALLCKQAAVAEMDNAKYRLDYSGEPLNYSPKECPIKSQCQSCWHARMSRLTQIITLTHIHLRESLM